MTKKKILIISIFIILASVILLESNNLKKIIYPVKYSDYVQHYAKEYNLDEYLVYSVIKAESKFKKNAISHKGAKGLMQISDITREWAAKELSLDLDFDIYDPKINIMIGCWYLNKLYKEFGKKELVIAAYNGGSGNVNKWLKNNDNSKDGRNLHNIPFKETSNYLNKVMDYHKQYRAIYSEKG